MVLKFDKEIVFAEDILQPGCLALGILIIAVQECLQNMATQATCGGYQTFMMAF